jgi:hypothetical protein
VTDLRARWRAEVLRSTAITDATRVLLLVLADRMRANGTVSVPRAELAKILGRSPQRITDRILAAKKAGLLDTVGGGYRGRTAVYVARLKGNRSTVTIKGPDGWSPLDGERSPDGWSPSSYVLKATTEQGGHDASRTRQGVPTAHPGRPLARGSPGRASRKRESTPDLSPSLSSSPFGDHSDDRNAAHGESADVLASRGDHKRGKSA